MQTVKNFKKGTFSYKFRIIHAGKGKRTECALIVLPGDYFSSKKKDRRSSPRK